MEDEIRKDLKEIIVLQGDEELSEDADLRVNREILLAAFDADTECEALPIFPES